MKAWLIYTTEPELKSLGLAWTEEIALDTIAASQMRENAKREAAAADASGDIFPPTPRWINAKAVVVELR